MNRICKPGNARGFTLIEVAIVIVIISLLLGGMLYPLGQQRFDRKNKETTKQMVEFKEALYGFAIRTGRLPCPDLTAGPGSNDGIEDTGPCGTTGTASSGGNLPWATLGLSSGDAWGGNRFYYRVAEPFALTTFTCATLPSAPNDLQLFSSCDPACLAADRLHAPQTLAAIIVSYGKNGRGALNNNNVFNPAPIGADELENSDADDDFVDREHTDANTAQGEFDDLVETIPVTLLCSRMVQAGKL